MRWSGPTAAWAYKNINPSTLGLGSNDNSEGKLKRVFLLGPAHKTPVDGAALSYSHEFATPIGNLEVDREVTEVLATKDHFTYYSKDAEEKEHSLEMHLPYIQKVFRDYNIKIVPIVVGSISLEKSQAIAKELSPYFQSQENFFVISSDFCHWGVKFSFMPFEKKLCEECNIPEPTVNQYIE